METEILYLASRSKRSFQSSYSDCFLECLRCAEIMILRIAFASLCNARHFTKMWRGDEVSWQNIACSDGRAG
ncbi:hypothetical protein TDB9533_01812 [Thalassocella blandensis]|nr:hypothetical protein TDB9533_01812 [Thalassocella blandensis]